MCIRDRTRADRITNEETKRRMETERRVIDYIEEKRLVWYGHVRRAQNRLINKVTEWSPLGRRKRGRPRRSWRDEVDESMQRIGPVSYTHLDVYKRQTNNIMIFKGRIPFSYNIYKMCLLKDYWTYH